MKIDHTLDGLMGIDILRSKTEECCRRPYKLVFVDLHMPRMNGDAMMKELDQLMMNEPRMGVYRDSFFILQTGDSQRNDQHWRSLGFHYVLAKPIDLEELKKIIRIASFDQQVSINNRAL